MGVDQLSVKFNQLYEQLLEELLIAEKWHGKSSEIASGNRDWELSDREAETVSRIKNWRRVIDNLCTDIINSGVLKNSENNDEILNLKPMELLEDTTSEDTSSKPAQENSAIPEAFSLFGKDYKVKMPTWGNLYYQVCEILVLYCPYVISILNVDKILNTESAINFSYIQSEIKNNPQRLSNGLWIETESSDIMTICYQLIEKCGFEHDELQIITTNQL